MERGSSKHGVVRDEQLSRETRAAVQGPRSEWREPEPAGEDQPGTGRMPADQAIGGTPAGMSGVDVASRNELARYLPYRSFPATAARLAHLATAEGTDRARRPDPGVAEGAEYASVTELAVALGYGREDDSHRA